MHRFGKLACLVVFCVSISFSACSHGTQSRPKENRSPQSSADIKLEIQQVSADMRDPAKFNADSCATYLDALTLRLQKMSLSLAFPRSSSEQETLKAQGTELIQSIFGIRLQARERLRQWVQEGRAPSSECIDGLRRGQRTARVAEDLLGDWLMKQGVLTSPVSEMGFFKGGFPNILSNPRMEPIRFETGEGLKAGDVFMVRGATFVSAFIARTGDEDSQFAHLAIVHRDGDGRLWVMESLIEHGLIIRPYDEFMRKIESRAVLFRHPDAALAARASQAIYDRARESLKPGRHIDYNFSMNLQDNETLFCSQVVQWAYFHGSKGKLDLPLYRTAFRKMHSRSSLLKDTGVSIDESFAPGDMEVEPRFELVAEWRDFGNVVNTQRHDALMVALFEWVMDKKYAPDISSIDIFMGNLGKLLRHFGLMKDKLPRNMPRGFLYNYFVLQDAFDRLESKAATEVRKIEETQGFPVSFREYLNVLDQIRKDDCREFWQQTGNPDWEGRRKNVHSRIRAPGQSCD